MAMSKKAQALLTGEKSSEWNEYRISMQEAYNDFMAEQAKAEDKQSSKSGWSKLAGAVMFGLAVAATGGLAGIGIAGLKFGTAAALNWGLGSLVAGVGVGAATAWGVHEGQDEVTLGKTKEEFMANIHDPKFGQGEAAAEKSAFGADIQRDITALESYEAGGLESALFENVGRASSYIPSPSFKAK